MYCKLNRIVETIAKVLALVGGLVLLAIIIMTSVSIAGRALIPLDIGLGPIRGIYDFTEIGIAAAIFAFLPWAHLRDAHARVDLFEPIMPKVMDKALGLLFSIGMFVVASVVAYRLFLGMIDKLSYGETTVIAGIPVWQGYAGGLIGGIGFVFVAAFCVLKSIRRLVGWSDAEETA